MAGKVNNSIINFQRLYLVVPYKLQILFHFSAMLFLAFLDLPNYYTLGYTAAFTANWALFSTVLDRNFFPVFFASLVSLVFVLGSITDPLPNSSFSLLFFVFVASLVTQFTAFSMRSQNKLSRKKMAN